MGKGDAAGCEARGLLSGPGVTSSAGPGDTPAVSGEAAGVIAGASAGVSGAGGGLPNTPGVEGLVEAGAGAVRFLVVPAGAGAVLLGGFMMTTEGASEGVKNCSSEAGAAAGAAAGGLGWGAWGVAMTPGVLTSWLLLFSAGGEGAV